MADRWSCASTTGAHPRGRLCSTYRGGVPVRLGSQGLAWSPCTSWISENAPDISLTQRCGRRASAGLKPNRRVYPADTVAHLALDLRRLPLPFLEQVIPARLI